MMMKLGFESLFLESLCLEPLCLEPLCLEPLCLEPLFLEPLFLESQSQASCRSDLTISVSPAWDITSGRAMIPKNKTANNKIRMEMGLECVISLVLSNGGLSIESSY
jgi:hypothetical protein